MKTPSASKHRLAGRNLPKLDRYNGYSHQSHQDRGLGGRIRETGYQIDQNCVQYEQNFKLLSEDSGCKQQLQPSIINLLFRCLWFWSFVKSYKNICVNNCKTKSVKYLPINDTSKTGRQILITGPGRREREIFWTEPCEIFTMSQWALSRHKFRPGPH